MNKLILTVVVALIAVLAHAKQEGTRIFGNLKNGEGNAVEAVTVTLLQLPTKKVIKINLSNAKGLFEFDNIKEGSYMVTFTAAGFEAASTDSFTTRAAQPELELQLKPLIASAKNLGNVVVEGKRNMVENKVDKMVVNVDAMISNTGSTALEVLEKSPGISVDRDGNISLKGKQGVLVLIDGKPSYLSATDLANYLRSMSSNQLDQVEIMTQPPAKYDASGNSGVINIKTKKNRQNGFNGNISLGFVQAVYPKSPNSISINLRKNKFNVFANYGFTYWQGFSDVTILRTFKNSQGKPTSIFDQLSRQQNVNRSSTLKMGVDFYASKKTTFGIVLNGNYNPRDYTVESRSDIMNSNYMVDSFNVASSADHTQWKNLGGNLNFRQLLNDKGRELTADADYIWYNSNSRQANNNYMYLPSGTLTQNPYLIRGYLPSDIKIYSLKADYTHPLKEGERFEAGLKTSYVKTDNNAIYDYYAHASSTWKSDANRSNHFLYEENVNAIYGNYNKQFKKWGVQAGLRVENTIGKGKLITNNTSFKRNYTGVFPTLYISHTPNDKNSFSISYGRRIERPNYQDMNPFQYFLDQFTYRQGNPYLMPQYSNNIELAHTYKGKLVTTLNYTVTNDIINDVLRQNDTTKVLFQTKDNIAKRTNIGLSLSYNNNITKWYQISVYGQVFNNHFTGLVNNSPLDVSIASFLVNLNNQFRFKKGWGAELSGFYRSKTQEAGIIVSKPMGVFSLAGSKQILNTKGTIKLGLTDPFWIQKFSGYTKFDNIDAVIRSKWDNRRIVFSFSYRFGKTMQQQAPRRRNGSAQDEQNRVGGSQNQ